MTKKKVQPNIKEIEKAIKEMEKTSNWQEFTTPNNNPRPPIVIPSIWTTPPRGHELDDDWQKRLEEQQTVAFMQECRERTAAMKDDEKCARCKLRFRCYTEIKIEKKRKTRTTKRKITPQNLAPASGIIRGKTISSVVLDEFDGVNDEEWLKVIKDVAENTRPNT